MAKYKITIVETLSRIIEIELNRDLDENDALSIVKNQYYEGDIILDAEDFDDVDFMIYEDE
jgi:hypothetical protein